jgi:hypothetical protein
MDGMDGWSGRGLVKRLLAVLFITIASFAALAQGIVVGPEEPFLIPVWPKASNAPPFNPRSPADVLTQRNNNQRTGMTLSSSLDQSAVAPGRFGLLHQFELPDDGAVLAQPLYMDSVAFRKGHRSGVFIATASNKVYAFNANPPFEQMWRKDLGPSEVPDMDGCPWLAAGTERPGAGLMQGIEATPVIDPSSGRIFVSFRDDGGIQRLAALDITDGSILRNKPSGQDLNVNVEPNNKPWHRLHRNRASLLLADGVVFVAFAAVCEEKFVEPYHGRVLAFDASTLERLGSYETTHDADGGGIWQASTGLAADSQGDLFFATGNARKTGAVAGPDPAGENLANSAVRLKVTLASHKDPLPPTTQRTAIMTPVDWFTPYRKAWLDREDMDFGSAGVVLIPGTSFLVAGGKEGIIYLLNQRNMGKFDAQEKFDASPVFFAGFRASMPDDEKRDHVAQKFTAGWNRYLDDTKIPMNDWTYWPHIHGTPVFGVLGEGKAFLYVWPEKDHLKSYRWLGNHFDKNQVIEATGLPQDRGLPPDKKLLAPPRINVKDGALGMPGGMLSLTLDRTKPGKGVLFASVQRCRWGTPPLNSPNPAEPHEECAVERCSVNTSNGENCGDQRWGILRAFDPVTLAELWNDQLDDQAGQPDRNYWYAKFVPPTIANGRVFLATWSNKVRVYGILNH